MPEGPSASIFNRLTSWFDAPMLGGAGPSGQLHEARDLSGCYLPWQSAVSMAGPLAHRPQDFGSTATPLDHPLNTFGATLLLDPMGYMDPTITTDLVLKEYLSSAVGNNQRAVPPLGTEGVGGGYVFWKVRQLWGSPHFYPRSRISVHSPAPHGVFPIVQSPRQAHRQARPPTDIPSND